MNTELLPLAERQANAIARIREDFDRHADDWTRAANSTTHTAWMLNVTAEALNQSNPAQYASPEFAQLDELFSEARARFPASH